MAEFVRVPETDWQNILDAVREKTGNTEKMVSGMVATEINGMETGDNGMADALLMCTVTEIDNNTVPSIGPYALTNHTALKRASFTEATTIGSYAFTRSGLVTANFPKVTDIGTGAFARCDSLTCLDFGALWSLGNYSFEFCPALTTLVLRRTDDITELSNANAFNSTPFKDASGVVYCPAAFIQTYQNATNWSALYAAGTCNFVAIEGSEYE
jgi:hypothetical protein